MWKTSCHLKVEQTEKEETKLKEEEKKIRKRLNLQNPYMSLMSIKAQL